MSSSSGNDHAGMFSPGSAPESKPNSDQKPTEVYRPRLFSSLIIALSYVLDVQEDPHLYHGWRVAAVATTMAQQLMEEQVGDVFFASLLHDIGVMGLFSHIVHYPIRHSQEITPEVVAHPHHGAEIVRSIPGLELAAEFVADHHEWWDGNGYPSGKSGEEIPLGAQLIRVADTVDINRRFQPGLPEQAIELAKLFANIEVSPDVAEAFESVVSQGKFHQELTDETKLLGLIHKIEAGLTLPIFRPCSDVTGTILTIFARIVDSKHGFTSGHSERVAIYAINLAKTLELPHDEITKVRFAGLLHDVGKVSVPASIIDKPGPLDSKELFQIKHYPILTMSIIGDIAYLSELAWTAGHHHEHWDGTGYPDGLLGDEIPLLSRILAVANAMDAITSPRAYRPAKRVDEALVIIRQAAGTQFDPQVVDAAYKVWQAGPLAV